MLLTRASLKTLTTTTTTISFASNARKFIFITQDRLISQKKLREIRLLKKRISTKKMSSSLFDDDGNYDSYEPEFFHGESVVDRKSVFQGHCCVIHQVDHVDLVLDKLKENKKIETAFHNMWAYRIDKNNPTARVAGKSASIVQDCDDDGEQAAGVTRWYGGIQLGPARFKHINNAARDSLVKGGFVNDNRQTTDEKADGGAEKASKSGSKNTNKQSKKKK